MLLLLNFYGLEKVVISLNFTARIDQVRNSFEEQGLDGFIIASPSNRSATQDTHRELELPALDRDHVLEAPGASTDRILKSYKQF